MIHEQFRQLYRWSLAVLFAGSIPWALSAQAPGATLKPEAQRKALVMGIGGPEHSHPESAKKFFLVCVGNPSNDPAKGWTCDFSWDVMKRIGLDPRRTSEEILFAELDRRQMGYRIAIACGPNSITLPYWGAALDHGIMPFAAQGNNVPQLRIPDEIGLRGAVGVAGGSYTNLTSYGPGVEFIDALARGVSSPYYEEAVQSYSNQRVAARFAKILDAHPEYNIWDARQHLRQTATFWASGWTEMNGYGRPRDEIKVDKLEPAPPVDFQIRTMPDRRRVLFSWRNFAQTGFSSTVISRSNGQIIYEGTNSNFTWLSDTNGIEEFTYWSKNSAGEKSRLEMYQHRKVLSLESGAFQSCAVFGASPGEEVKSLRLSQLFQEIAKGWNCDQLYQTGNAYYDQVKVFPEGPVAGVFPDFSAMTRFAISNYYRVILAPVNQQEADLFHCKPDWDRAVAAGVAVVLPHHASTSTSRKPQARRLSPPRLFSAITVGFGVTNNLRSFGPGLEFFDTSEGRGTELGITNQMDAAAVVAGKLARILQANPQYNIWDARQHLRQNSSDYAQGWREDGGFGRPALEPLKRVTLDPAPPVDIQVRRLPDGQSIELSWMNFQQTTFDRTVVQANGHQIYSGDGTNMVWKADLPAKLKFYTQDRNGKLSRDELFTVVEVRQN